MVIDMTVHVAVMILVAVTMIIDLKARELELGLAYGSTCNQLCEGS